MAISTPTIPGQILTSAYVNNNINSGLVYVTSVTVGSAVSSVTISSAFNSTYDAYKIVATNVAASSNGVVTFQMSGITTGYYGNLIYSGFLGAAPSSAGMNNAANVSHGGGTNSQILTLNIDVINPFLAKAQCITCKYIDNTNAGTVQVYNNQTTSATGFVLTPAFGTLTGGQITVYGYRKA